MPVEVILPKVDMDMTHGTLAAWHVREGEAVAKGAALFDIETDKAAMEVEAPASGRLQHVAARAGDRIPVGAVIAWIYAEGEAVGPRPSSGERPAEIPAPSQTAVDPQPVFAQAAPEDSVERGPRATPAARSAARAAHIPLSDIVGTGPKGRIQRGDVESLLKAAAAPGPAGAVVFTREAGPLRVTRRDGHGIPLVLVHGFTADSTSWAPLEKALGPGRALIRIDLPGHGGSPKRDVRDFAHLARMLVEAFDAATAGHDVVHLLGHSLGGALAVAIADVRATRVRSLTLIAPAGLGPEIDADALAGIVRAGRAESLAPWLRRLTAVPEAIGDDYARAAMRGRAEPALRACQAAMLGALFPDGVQAFDLRAAMARLALPAAIVWGRRDRILPWRQALAVDGDFAIHVLKAAGHVPQIECPERVAAIVARHLAAGDIHV
ncbi:acetoin dehydrogenase dihydrolipoyllysine-residue acetyltransferase subunit [Ensifer soli]|uniref:acetoin dehydrogenase dihydrolipoyllysine-residue acetyltransferase subunit n=1 Tax=Ciceribacter sp. sgz301302 TaxID=3342379 RepID=UPI0035BBEECB